MKFLEYKGYTGSIEYSREDNLLYGSVLGIQGLISYEGTTGNQLEEDFQQAIDQYIEACEKDGNPPEKPFKGSFNVRIASDLHREAVMEALSQNSNLNTYVSEAIREKLSK